MMETLHQRTLVNMDTPFERLVIPEFVLDAMFSQAVAARPCECCGVLAGTIAAGVGSVRQNYPVRNELASETRYQTNPRDLLSITRTTRLAGWEWLAIYHSHPTSPAIPSQTDLEQNTYGLSVAHVILGLPKREVRGWWLGEDSLVELAVEISTGPQDTIDIGQNRPLA